MKADEPSRLNLLKAYLGDDPVQVKEVGQLFLDTFPADLLELELACGNGNIDYSKLQKTSHRLKSSIRLFDIKKPYEIILAIESLAKNHADCTNILQLIQQFKTSMQAEVEIIRNELQNL